MIKNIINLNLYLYNDLYDQIKTVVVHSLTFGIWFGSVLTVNPFDPAFALNKSVAVIWIVDPV